MTDKRGFTIIEVLIAVLVLTVGVLGLATTAALVTRMIGQGQRYSEASTMAAQQFEVLRSRRCASMANGTQTRQGFTMSWTVADAAGGKAKSVRIVVVSPRPRGARSDTFTTTILC